MTTLMFKKLYADAAVPSRGSKQAIGLDVFAYLQNEAGRSSTALIPPRTTRSIPTGMGVIVPQTNGRWHLQMVSNSDLAKRSLFVANAPGILNPDHTDEIMVLLYNGSNEAHYVKHGDRIAHLILAQTPTFEVKSYDN